VSRPDLRPTQPPIQGVPGALSLGVKRLGCEDDHSPPSSAKVKECMKLYLHSPIRLHGVVHRDNLTFTFKVHFMITFADPNLLSLLIYKILFPSLIRKEQIYDFHFITFA
jgi:hypothetical protein